MSYRRAKSLKICAVCGAEFISPKGNHKTCSKECSKIHCAQYKTTEYKNAHTNFENQNKKRKIYYQKNKESIKKKSISRYYSGERERRMNDFIDVECCICGEVHSVKRLSYKVSDKSYCSTKCRSIGYKELIGGDKSHLWKGGITPTHNKIRNSSDYKQWVKDVFKKDDYTCQCCGGRGVKISAHHKKNFSKLYPTMDDLLWDVENGITFCLDCHDVFHVQYGKIDNNQEQVKEFLGYVI